MGDTKDESGEDIPVIEDEVVTENFDDGARKPGAGDRAENTSGENRGTPDGTRTKSED